MAVVQSVEGTGAWARIRFAGEIDVAATDLLRDTIDSALVSFGDASVLEIDVTDVTLVDSTAVGLLVGSHRTLAERGVRLIVTNPAKIVERVMKVTGVYDLLTASGVSAPRRRGSSSR